MCVWSGKQDTGQGQATGQKRKWAAVMDVIVLSEGSEEPVVRAPVPKRLVAIGMKPLVVSEKRRVLNVSCNSGGTGGWSWVQMTTSCCLHGG